MPWAVDRRAFLVCASRVFATYVHDLDPIIFQFGDKLALRWYGLAYLMGFFVGYALLQFLANRQRWVLSAEKAGDFIAMAALFGVFLGGRLGYVLFYMIPDKGLSYVLQDPFVIFKVWEGGMASHGGILGLAIFTWFYARKHKVTWTGLGDGLCVVAPVGLFFGRIANFINGELYGRVANGVAWAMKFPNSLWEESLETQSAAWQACQQADPSLMQIADPSPQLIADAVRENPAVKAAIEPYLQPRHPSQLYEALLEGVVLFSVLFFVRMRWKKLPDGLLTGLFFLLYAVLRIVGEQFREPDSAMVFEGLVTKGQFFSGFMIFGGLAFLAWACTGGKKVRNAK